MEKSDSEFHFCLKMTIEDDLDEAIELVKHLAIDELNIHHLMTNSGFAQLSQ